MTPILELIKPREKVYKIFKYVRWNQKVWSPLKTKFKTFSLSNEESKLTQSLKDNNSNRSKIIFTDIKPKSI